MSVKTIQFTPALYHYFQQVSLREPEILKSLREETHQLSNWQMQIAPEQGQLMAFLVELMNAKKALEIGTFTGYSALVTALALPADGKLIACDINEQWTQIGRKYWAQAGVSHKIDLRLAPAKETLQQIIDEGEANTFDFIFIDADKTNYDNYYEKSLVLVRKGGLIAIDNVLWGGEVADPTINDNATVAIRTLNTKLYQDERISLSLVPIGDGLTLAKKR